MNAVVLVVTGVAGDGDGLRNNSTTTRRRRCRHRRRRHRRGDSAADARRHRRCRSYEPAGVALRAIILIATLATQDGMRNLPPSARLGDSQLAAGMRARACRQPLATALWRVRHGVRFAAGKRTNGDATARKTNRVESDCSNLELGTHSQLGTEPPASAIWPYQLVVAYQHLSGINRGSQRCV